MAILGPAFAYTLYMETKASHTSDFRQQTNQFALGLLVIEQDYLDHFVPDERLADHVMFLNIPGTSTCHFYFLSHSTAAIAIREECLDLFETVFSPRAASRAHYC